MPLVMALATIGVYAINSNPFELYLALCFGILGYLFRKVEIPLAPLVLAVVLGAPMEESFRQALQVSDGHISIFVSSGIGITLVVMSVVSIAAPLLFPMLRKWKAGPEDLKA